MAKKWFVRVVLLFSSIMLAIATLVYILDPYFYFHAPYKNISYTLGNYVYQNDGIAKHFDYDTVIIGTSMTEHFSTEEVDQLFDAKSIRLTFLGEGYRRINDCLTEALECNDRLKLVIRGVDPIWFVSNETFLAYGTYDDYPTYLYDKTLINSYKYIYNPDIIFTDCRNVLLRTIRKQPHDIFDSFDKNMSGGIELVKADYVRQPKNPYAVNSDETNDMLLNLQRNIELNVVSTIKDNPNTRFIIFFPPYSIVFWDELMQKGIDVVERRYLFEQYAIEELLKYDNVELYSFMDCYDITTDLNNYTDHLHYLPKYNSYMLKSIKNGEHRLTEENYIEYLSNSKSFYENYDYDAVFSSWEANE